VTLDFNHHKDCQANDFFTPFNYRVDDETNSKHGDEDEEIRSTKDGEDRPSSSGLF
jgi:hypothetical protein